MQSTVPWRREFLSGAIAAVAFLAIYFVVRFIWQIPALPEAVIEGILNFIPPALFEAVIQIFGSMAKTLNFYAILIGMVGAGGLLGLLYGRLLARIGANDNSGGDANGVVVRPWLRWVAVAGPRCDDFAIRGTRLLRHGCILTGHCCRCHRHHCLFGIWVCACVRPATLRR